MTLELWTLLGFAAILLMTILMQSMVFSAKNGIGETLGSRDGGPENPGLVEPRLQRAVRNGLEAMAIYTPLVLVAHAVGVSNGWTALGATVFLIARTLHPIFYAIGAVPYASVVHEHRGSDDVCFWIGYPG